jgi:putative DNA primase/helicase
MYCGGCGSAFKTKDRRRKLCTACKIAKPVTLQNGAPVNEVGLAKEIVTQYGDDIKYDMPTDRFYLWDGKQWNKEKKEPLSILELTTSHLDTALGKQMSTNQKIQTKYESDIAKLQNYQKIKNIVKGIRYPTRHEFGEELFPFHVNTNTGLVDLKTGEVVPHSREHYCTHLIPTYYDLDAKDSRFDQIVYDVCDQREDLMKFLQIAVGYSMFGDNPNAKMFIMYGPKARNGKSTFLNILRDVVGNDLSQQLDWSTLRHSNKKGGASPELIRMKGKRFVISTESERDRKLSEQWIKAQTGGEAQVARGLYQEYEEFRPLAKIWLNTNFLPLVDSTDDGIWRRMEVIPFDRQFLEADDEDDLRQRMRAESSQAAILAWIVKGAMMYAETPPADRWKWSPTVTASNAEYRAQLSPIVSFLKSRMYRTSDEGVSIRKKLLYRYYKDWCLNMNVEPEGKHLFNRGVAHYLGHEAKRDSGGEFWPGLAVDKLAPLDDD